MHLPSSFSYFLLPITYFTSPSRLRFGNVTSGGRRTIHCVPMTRHWWPRGYALPMSSAFSASLITLTSGMRLPFSFKSLQSCCQKRGWVITKYCLIHYMYTFLFWNELHWIRPSGHHLHTMLLHQKVRIFYKFYWHLNRKRKTELLSTTLFSISVHCSLQAGFGSRTCLQTSEGLIKLSCLCGHWDAWHVA